MRTGFCCFILAIVLFFALCSWCFVDFILFFRSLFHFIFSCWIRLSISVFFILYLLFSLILFWFAIKYSHGEMCVMHMCCWQRFISERIVSRKPFRTFVGVERAFVYRFLCLTLRALWYDSERKILSSPIKIIFFAAASTFVHTHTESNERMKKSAHTHNNFVEIAMEESEKQSRSAKVLGTTLILC